MRRQDSKAAAVPLLISSECAERLIGVVGVDRASILRVPASLTAPGVQAGKITHAAMLGAAESLPPATLLGAQLGTLVRPWRQGR